MLHVLLASVFSFEKLRKTESKASTFTPSMSQQALWSPGWRLTVSLPMTHFGLPFLFPSETGASPLDRGYSLLFYAPNVRRI